MSDCKEKEVKEEPIEEVIMEWRKVTNASELHIGQGVRYKNKNNLSCGYEDSRVDKQFWFVQFINKSNNTVDVLNYAKSTGVYDIFNNKDFYNVEALFEIKGEWRVVTSADEVYAGQRVRYVSSSGDRYGFTIDNIRRISSVSNSIAVDKDDNVCHYNIFDSDAIVEAFFPYKEPDKDKKENFDHEVEVKIVWDRRECWHFEVFSLISPRFYMSKSSAIRAARNLCKNRIKANCNIVID